MDNKFINFNEEFRALLNSYNDEELDEFFTDGEKEDCNENFVFFNVTEDVTEFCDYPELSDLTKQLKKKLLSLNIDNFVSAECESNDCGDTFWLMLNCKDFSCGLAFYNWPDIIYNLAQDIENNPNDIKYKFKLINYIKEDCFSNRDDIHNAIMNGNKYKITVKEPSEEDIKNRNISITISVDKSDEDVLNELRNSLARYFEEECGISRDIIFVEA
jgi:hypothetical protein